MSPIHAITVQPLTWKARVQLTAEAMDDPQPGDEFNEMFSHWVMVTERNGDRVKWSAGQGPTDDFFRDFPPQEATVSEFKKRYSYGGTTAGYWVTISRRRGAKV